MTSELFQKIRNQYNSCPYPTIPIEQSPKKGIQRLYLNNFTTAYYIRNQKAIGSEGKFILDAGCGSGYKTLVLAEANPGAKIIGVDVSEKSIEVSRQRLEHHGFKNVEFHVLPLEEIPNLGLKFDYINNDEVLYLLPDPIAGFQALKSVLEDDGIIHTNLHSALQRANVFRGQEFCKMVGFMDENPGDLEIELLQEIMEALKDSVLLKITTWPQLIRDDPKVALTNHLLQGDKGYTIPQLFALLEQVNMEFISMVNWRQWDLTELFKTPENLPAFLSMSLPSLSVEEQLRVFELLHPIHRLLDFWCGHPKQARSFVPVTEWEEKDWKTAIAHLHPQLRIPETKEKMLESISQFQAFPISQCLPIPGLYDIWIDSAVINCILPLWEESGSVISLVKRWTQLRPLDPISVQNTTEEEALKTVTQMLATLAEYGYVLLER